VDWQAIQLSLQLALATTVVLLLMGAPLAYWLSSRRSVLATIIESVVASPLVIPPTVLGLVILLAIGPRGPVGRAYESITGGTLPFSFAALLMASLLFSLPFAVQPMVAAFSSVDRRLIDASRCLGAGSMKTFLQVVLPLSIPGICAGAVLTFAHTMGEFGVVLMGGGGIPGKTRTASVSIYDAVQSMEYERALRTSLFLVSISVMALIVTAVLRRRATL